MRARYLLSYLLSGTATPKVVLPLTRCAGRVATRYLQTHETATDEPTDLQISPQHQDDLDQLRINLNPFDKPLDEGQKSFISDLNPPLKRSYNLAAYVNTSKTLQQLIRVGVSLFDIENVDIEAAKKLVLLDYQRDCVPYMKFLVDNGLKPKNLGRFISEFPRIFHVPMQDLEIRIKYLKLKHFSKAQIANALNRSSRLLVESVKTLDYKLGAFQVEFRLPANSVRTIVSKYPPVISLPEGQYRLVNFSLTEEFGFKAHEVRELLEQQPRLLDLVRSDLIERLDLVHNIIGLDHKTILKFPKLLTGPRFEIRHRFIYLKKLKRNQFDPKLPLYVPPSALYNDSDAKFCEMYTKTSPDDYKLFLRSL